MKLYKTDFLIPGLICKIRPFQEVLDEFLHPKVDYQLEVIVIQSPFFEHYYPRDWDTRMVRIKTIGKSLCTIELLDTGTIYPYPVSSIIFEDIYLTERIKLYCERIILQNHCWTETNFIIENTIDHIRENRDITKDRLESLFRRISEQQLNFRNLQDLVVKVNNDLKELYPDEICI